MRSNYQILIVASLLVLAVASTILPVVSATAKLGKMIPNPTHAVPGTLVSFEGEGWDLPASDITCWINGAPVKIDRHAICEIGGSKGANEPVGTFIVKDVPAGTYSVFVTVTMYTRGGLAFNLTAEQPFTVDAATTITTATTDLTSVMTTAATSLCVCSVASRMEYAWTHRT